MARRCTICNHPKRNEIENAILDGMSIKDAAVANGVTVSSLWRHRQKHMVREAAEAINAAGQGMLPLPYAVSPGRAMRIVRHFDAAEEILHLHDEALKALNSAKREGSIKYTLQAIGVIQDNLELMGKLQIMARLDKQLDDDGTTRTLSEGLEELVEQVAAGVSA